jgi:hypothetical protein
MTLTGKCKEAFESYLEELNRRDIEGVYCDYNGTFYCYNDYHFSCLPESMRCGVYVDFFDSVGMTVLINTESTECWWGTILEEGIMSPYFKTRHEALTSAIEKANKIYNKRL